MTNPTYFTVIGDFKSIVADSLGDTDADPDSVSLLATVTFQPVINDGDLILATNASPRPTAFVAAPIAGFIDTDGLLKMRAAGASGYPGLSYTPVRLLADTALLELAGDLFYDVTFSNVSYNGRTISLNGFRFQAPTSDVTLNLVTVARAPGQPATAITKIAPTGVRFANGSMIFSFSGVDIPENLPLSSITGPQGPQGAQGIQGQAGVSLDINGTVATYSNLPSGEPDGSAYIVAADGLLYYRFDGAWPADGAGVPFVGPAGPTGAQGVQGASGIPGVSGTPGLTGATGPEGPMGATGASGGTGGTGLAGQSVSLKGAVATYSLLPGSATNGDGYILLTDNLLYVWNGSWPAEGSGVPFVGPVGATGASGVPGPTGATGATGASGGTGGTGGTGEQGATGEVGPTGATGASGGTGGTGGTGAAGGTGASGASGVGAARSITTVTANTTLGSDSGTDYVVYANIATIPASVDHLKDVARLACDGSDESTTITDSGYLASNFTANGNAKLSTSTKKYGTASVSFDGSTSSYINSTAAASNFTFGTGDFTIEFWVLTNAASTSQGLCDFTTGSGTRPTLFISNSNQITFESGSVFGIFGTIATSTWYHVALARSSGTLRGFLNGTQGFSVADSNSYTATVVTFGRWYTTSLGFNGFLDDIRIIKGGAAYTSNFTAPTDALPASAAAVPAAITLPAVNTNMYRVGNLHPDSLSVKPQSGQSIDGATGVAMAQNDKKLFISDGATGWRTW